MLQLAKLLFDSQGISIDELEMYLAWAVRDTNLDFDSESKLEIFKQVVINGNYESNSVDYRQNKEDISSHKTA